MELRRVAAARPDQAWLNKQVNTAERAFAESVWVPPSPRELVDLISDPDRRLVQSNAQLSAVVVESLKRANERLQGSWPKAWQLWNDDPATPKSEERLSDWVKDWLDDDLARRLVTSREPQVRPTSRGRGIGPRNDLRVELPALGDLPPIAIIIEVKRHWHPKVFTAIRTQLVEDYLQSAGLSTGIYLVGFYASPRWKGAGSKATRERSLPAWQSCISKLADDVSTATGREVAGFVLDASLQADQANR